jgi:3-hydroxyisobutyrate dehydrogenase
MAGHLVKAGTSVVVWNRTPGKAERVQGAEVAGSLQELAQACDVIITCVNKTEDVQEIIDQLQRHAQPNTLFIDHSTIAPPAAKRIQEQIGRFVDAPITGGSMGAQNGTLTVFLGGQEDDVDQALQVIKPYTRRGERVGPPGAGQMAKMANQIAVGGALMGLCECLAFAEKAGLDLNQIKEMVGGGAGGSWAFENYGPKVLAHDWSPGFSVKNQRKDFNYCEEAAESINAQVPGTKLVNALLAELENNGRGEEATCALFDVLNRP